MKPIHKIYSVSAILAILMATVAGCVQPATAPTVTPTPAPTTRTITDMTGKTVVIPAKIDRIADAWPAHNSLLVMLGDKDKIVATTPVVQAIPWFKKLAPHISTIPGVFSADVNMEELLKAKPDVVVLSQGSDAMAKKITEAGIPVVTLYFTDFTNLKECVLLTGKMMGDNESARASQYVAYLDGKLQMLNSRASTIPDGQKLRVVHAMSVSPLKVDGRNTLINTWIEIAGGVNAAGPDVDGNGKEVSMEQLLKWDPDVILIGGTTQIMSQVKNDAQWQKLKAMQSGRAYLNPKGVFPWDRYGPEEALQIQWAAKTLYPDKFADVDIQKETLFFYKTFFGYDLSDDEVKDIMNPQA